MKTRKYTNTDFIIRRGMMVILFIGGILITFVQTFFQMFSSKKDTETYKVLVQ